MPRLRGPGVPGVDVQVGTADSCLTHADEDIVDPDLGLRHILQPETRLGLRLDQGFHAASTTTDPSADIMGNSSGR